MSHYCVSSFSAPPWLGTPYIACATILFGVGAVWTLKTSWTGTTWPPNVPVDHAKALRRQRRAAISTCCLAPLIIGTSIAMIASGAEDVWFYALFIIIGVVDLLHGIVRMRAAKTHAATTEDAA